MPKDPKRNVDRYKVRGGDLNEFEYAQNQAQVKESGPPSKGAGSKKTAKPANSKKAAKPANSKKAAKPAKSATAKKKAAKK